MHVTALIARFGCTYLPALALSIVGLRAAGTDAGTGSNLLVFLGCLFWATRPIKTGAVSLEAPGALGRVLAGVVAIDVLAQPAYYTLFFVEHGQKPGLLNFLPFVLVFAVVVQAALAYDMLRRRRRPARQAVNARIVSNEAAEQGR